MTLHCTQCQHRWPLPIALPASIEAFCRVLEEPCPECDAPATHILLSTKEPT